MYTGLMPMYAPFNWFWPRMMTDMAISSKLAFPALSPMPLMVHSTCLAPLAIPANEFAVDKPKSFWQCVLITASFALTSMTFSLIPLIKRPNSSGKQKPTVSGILIVVAPASTTAFNMRYKNSGSDLPASSGLNSISSHPKDFANFTAFTAMATTSSGVFFNLYSM